MLQPIYMTDSFLVDTLILFLFYATINNAAVGNLYFFALATLCGLRDLSSLTKD